MHWVQVEEATGEIYGSFLKMMFQIKYITLQKKPITSKYNSSMMVKNSCSSIHFGVFVITRRHYGES